MNGLCNSPPRFDKEAWQFENGLLTPLLWSPCLINVKRKCFLTKKSTLIGLPRNTNIIGSL